MVSRIVLGGLTALAFGCSEATPSAAVGSAEGGAADPGTGMGEKNPWVVAHNKVRAGIATSPALKPLAWSDSLASVARDAAKACSFEHTQNPYGENVFAGNVTALTEDFVVTAWAVEASGYDLASNTCSKAPCGHYKQLVWRDSERVGCAIATCTGQFSQIAFCMYDPPGYVAEKPY